MKFIGLLTVIYTHFSYIKITWNYCKWGRTDILNLFVAHSRVFWRYWVKTIWSGRSRWVCGRTWSWISQRPSRLEASQQPETWCSRYRASTLSTGARRTCPVCTTMQTSWWQRGAAWTFSPGWVTRDADKINNCFISTF